MIFLTGLDFFSCIMKLLYRHFLPRNQGLKTNPYLYFFLLIFIFTFHAFFFLMNPYFLMYILMNSLLIESPNHEILVSETCIGETVPEKVHKDKY